METMTPPPSPGRVVFREGLIFGFFLGVAHSILYILNSFLLVQYSLSTLGLLLIVLLWLGIFFWAGVRGAKQTGRVGTGTLTGLVTAVFAGIIAFIALMAIASIQVSSSGSSYQQILDIYNSQGVYMTYSTIFVVLAVCGIVMWLLGIGMGAAMGALGGLLGRSQSTVIPPPAYLAYPSPPPYGYGQPPMQPPYPASYPPPYPSPYPPPYQNQPPQSPNQPYG